jgi:hypothetical protein
MGQAGLETDSSSALDQAGAMLERQASPPRLPLPLVFSGLYLSRALGIDRRPWRVRREIHSTLQPSFSIETTTWCNAPSWRRQRGKPWASAPAGLPPAYRSSRGNSQRQFPCLRQLLKRYRWKGYPFCPPFHTPCKLTQPRFLMCVTYVASESFYYTSNPG